MAETQGDKVPKLGKGGLRATKKGIGATGVNLRYHTPDKYTTLTREQRIELSKWRLTQPKDPKKNDIKKSSIAAAVTKGVPEAMGAKKDAVKEEGTTSKGNYMPCHIFR